MLWIDPNDPDVVEWQSVSPATPDGEPAERFEQGADWLRASSRILITGGDTGDVSGNSSSEVWALDIAWPNKGTGFAPAWTEQPEATGVGLAGQTTMKDFVAIQALEPELYDPSEPAGSRWSTLTSADKRYSFYPFMYVLPSGNVFMAGPDRPTWLLDMGQSQPVWGANPYWTKFWGGASVMYRPGKIMKCRIDDANAAGDFDTERIVFAEDDDTEGWIGSNGFKDRQQHNLTLLPDGTVLATGGLLANGSTYVHEPQIWDPDANGGAGEWTPDTELMPEPADRRHHSVSILLPDARVLTTAEGNDVEKITIYAPPYLFTGNDLAERPEIVGAPTNTGYDDTVTACTPDAASITSACLIRASTTTHENNMDQRYVELPIRGSGSGEIYVATPKNANYAPPGDYMLFILKDNTANGTETPSIAAWVTLAEEPGPDACDEIAPGTTTDLEPEIVTNDTIYMTWSASADDSYQAASGRGEHLEFRYSQQAIATDQAWYSASLALQQQAPSVAGQGAAFSDDVTGLQSCTWYHFAVRMEDDNENLSDLPSEVKVKTLCSGGGGGGPSGATSEVVNAATGEATSTMRDGRRAGLSTQSGSSGSAAAALVVETESLADGAWRFTLQAPAEFADADASKMLRQVEDAAGTWQTRSDLELEGAGGRLGLTATGRAGRKVFPGTWELVEIASMLGSPAGDLALVSAEHSSLGELAQSTWSGEGSASLASGETLTLVYEPSQLETKATESWFALLQRTDGSSSPTRDLALGEGADLPKAFALYQNQPNPFSHTTSIRFDLPKATSVRLAIYDIAGRKVRTLTSTDWPAGRHSLEWDHRSDAGVRLGAGAYIYRLTTDEYRSEKKMILLAR